MSDDEDITFRTGTNHQSDKVMAWAEVMKLNTATANEMLELGFDSMEAVALIEKEDLDNSSIPIGQRKLLLRAVGKTFKKDFSPSERMAANSRLPAVSNSGACALQDGDDGSTVNKDGGAHEHLKDGGIQTNTDDAYVNAVLQQLTGQQTQYVHSSGLLDGRQNQNIAGNSNESDNSVTNLGNTGINSILSWQDPQIYLKHSNIDSKVNYLDIIDFVGNDIGGTSMPEERLISNASGGQLVFKSGPLRPKLESLSLCQWSRANLSIMYKLLSTGELAQTQILDYLFIIYHEILPILTEIENGNYEFAKSTPKIISPLGIIPKSDGGVRIIHDCSRPLGSAVNDFAGDVEKQKFQSVDDAAKLVTKNCFMAKVDLKSAYRSVSISSHSQQVTGLRWTFPDGQTHTFIDKKLPFGSKLAPGIFHRLSQAIRRMMSRRGFTIIAYLDDFFICEKTKQRCAHALRILIYLLRKLGFSISWSKVVDPCQKLVFLGVEIDSTTLELRLPIKKLDELRRELASFQQRKHVSKKQLQSLAGKLNWASSVVHGGRVFLRRIIDSIMQLKHDRHKMRLSGDIFCMISIGGIILWQLSMGNPSYSILTLSPQFTQMLAIQVQKWNEALSLKIPNGRIKDSYIKELADSLRSTLQAKGSEEELIEIYCLHTDSFEGVVQEILLKVALNAVGRCSHFKFKNIQDERCNLRLGELLSNVFETSWDVKKLENFHEAVDHAITWGPFPTYMELYCYTPNVLSDYCQGLLEKFKTIILDCIQQLFKGNIVIKDLMNLSNKWNSFQKLLIAIKIDDTESILAIMNLRIKEYESFKTTFQTVQEFVYYSKHCRGLLLYPI
ncbi:Hypothetical predicted protein [Mytilus galloprovincialis]|uniref:Reverse transcriptase domain-containing protein n=1 Tax=Mytilus galloprovincialis TaxID=29158 RepID=A0A8B6GXW1_MYTGA|nr:Hypothetical predicted protein [Mytilus galloprovincialis]